MTKLLSDNHNTIYMGWLKVNDKENWQTFFDNGLTYFKNKFENEPTSIQMSEKDKDIKIETTFNIEYKTNIPSKHILFGIPERGIGQTAYIRLG